MKMRKEGRKAVCSLLLLIIVVSLMLCGCGKKESAQVTTESKLEETEPTIVMTAPVFPEAVCFENHYCNLYFPIEWEENVGTIDETLDNGLRVTFVGKAEKKESPLFSLRFEEGENDGSALGSVVSPEGTQAWVYLEIIEFFPDETWAGEEVDVIYAMQECMNYVLKTLAAEAAYTPA